MHAAEANKLITELKNSYEEWLVGVLEEFRKELIGQFAKKSHSLTNRVAPQDFNEAIDKLETRHPAAKETLQTKLDQSFLKKPAAKTAVSLDELALVDDIEVERFVRRARMVTYLIQEHKADIKELEARLEQLHELGADVDTEALSPKRLFEVLKLALDEYKLPESARTVYVDTFSVRVIPKLGQGYQLGNRILNQHGISMRYELNNPDKRGRPANTPDARQQELVDTLQRLNENIHGIQKAGLLGGGLKPQLESSRPEAENSLQTAGLELVHAKNIASIENIILTIAEDDNLDPRAKELIKSLFLPLAIIVLQDADILSDTHHPGRLLIRELALFGQMDKATIDKRIGEVGSLVNHVIVEGAKDINTVAEVAESVWRITQQKDDSQVANHKQATASDTAQQMAEAKRRVVLQLREHLIDKQLPDALRPVLINLVVPWMLIRYLRYGHNSKPWLEAVAYLRVAVDAVQPAEDSNVLKRKIATRKHLLKTLEERSQKAALPDEQIQAMVGALETYFEKINKWDELRLTGKTTNESESPLKASTGVTEQDILDIQAALDKTELLIESKR